MAHREPVVDPHRGARSAGAWIGRGVAMGLLALLGAVFAGFAVGAGVASYRALLAFLFQ